MASNYAQKRKCVVYKKKAQYQDSVNYVQKSRGAPEPSLTADTSPISELAKDEKISKGIGLTKEKVLSLYAKSETTGLISDWVQKEKEIYSEISLPPECSKESSLPMTNFLVASRKSSTHNWVQHSESNTGSNNDVEEIKYEEKGIFLGTEEVSNSGNRHYNSNTPLWYQSDYNEEGYSNTDNHTDKSGAKFTLEGLSKRQDALEEEKRKFYRDSAKKEDKLEDLAEHCIYSNVDELFEKKINSHKLDDIFGKSNQEQKESLEANFKALDLSTLEANMIKQASADSNKEVKKENEVSEDEEETSKEEAPVWSTFSAEEIQKQSFKNISNWGIEKPMFSNNLDSEEEAEEKQQQQKEETETIDTLEKEKTFQDITECETIEEIPTANPFCPRFLKFRDTDEIWYYKDMQGITRGPFSSLQMHKWYLDNYFPPALQIKCGEDGMLTTLNVFLEGNVHSQIEQQYRPEYRRPYEPLYGYNPRQHCCNSRRAMGYPSMPIPYRPQHESAARSSEIVKRDSDRENLENEKSSVADNNLSGFSPSSK